MSTHSESDNSQVNCVPKHYVEGRHGTRDASNQFYEDECEKWSPLRF